MQDAFYTFNGKNLSKQALDFNEQDETNPVQRVRNYNVEALFDFFIQAAGVPARMIDLIDQLPPEKRCLFPKKVALYNIVKRENFARKYHKIFDVMKVQRESEVGMTFERLDSASRLVIGRYIERLMQKEEAAPLHVSHKDVGTMWQIMRTERGLVSNITHTTNAETGGGVRRMFEKKGVANLLEAFQSLPAINKKLLINQLEDGKSEIPKLLSRGGGK